MTAPPGRDYKTSGEVAPKTWNPDAIAAAGRTLMIRRPALRRLEDGRWIFYIGREPGTVEKPQVLFANGPREVGSVRQAPD